MGENTTPTHQHGICPGFDIGNADLAEEMVLQALGTGLSEDDQYQIGIAVQNPS
jgi:hypothetical protein